MVTSAQNLVGALVILVITIGSIGLHWLLLNKITTTIDDHKELFQKGNIAYLLQRLSLSLAQIIALLAVIPSFDTSYLWYSSLVLLLQAAWIFAALLIAYFTVDWILFPKIKNTDMLIDGNVSVGIVEAGFYVGIGFLLNGSLTGSAVTFGLSAASTVVFFILGLALVMGVFWLHELVTPYSLHDRIEEDDRSAALELAGILIAVSIVTHIGVAGDFVSWGISFLLFLVTAVGSIVVLYLVRWVTNRLILGNNTVRVVQRNKQPAAAGLQAGVLVIVALAVSTIVGYVV